MRPDSDAEGPETGGPEAKGLDTEGRVAEDRVAEDRVAEDRVAEDRVAEDRAPGDLSGAELLAAADRLLRGVRPGGADLWPRAVAFLLRAALEHALNELWARVEPRMLSAPRSAQLLVLPQRLDDARAARVAFVWAALSSACHHHTYELAPTPAELRRWHTDVAELIAAVEQA